MRRLMAILALVTVAMLGLVPLAGAVGERASGTLIDGSGNRIGAVELEQTASGVRATVRVAGLPAGPHGIHFHAVGKCDTPDFMTAGAHFNPTDKKHGLDNPAGPHAGDLPNLSSNAYTTTTDRVTLTAGPTSLFDADGATLVIHANADDNVTDPAGNSGGRIACAVITQQAPSLPNTGAGGAAAHSRWPLAALFGLATLALTALTVGLMRRRTA